MRVNFYANMRTLVARENFDISDLDDSTTLGKLLSDLVLHFPQIRSHLFDEAGNLRPDVPIFVNGRNPRLGSNGLETPVESDAVVSLFSPISSGRMNVEVMSDSASDTEVDL